jgi:hypothetical protein
MKHEFPLDVTPLLDWIKQYFDTQTEGHPTSVQDRWRAATPVVISDRMPLILQHQGHSRTIIGYEITKDGSTTLLTFDPAMYVFTPPLSPSGSFMVPSDA